MGEFYEDYHDHMARRQEERRRGEVASKNMYEPQVRRAAASAESTDRKLAAVVVAFLEANTNLAFEAMADLMGITLEEQGHLYDLAQKIIEREW